MKAGFITLTAAAFMVVLSLESSAVAQSSDTIQLNSGSLLRGRVTGTDKTSVSIKTRDDDRQIRIDEIKSLTLAGRPNQLTRAKSHLEDGRYDDCLKEIEKIDAETGNELIKTEIEYCQFAATAYNALSHGSTTTREAVSAISNFISTHPDSHHYYEMTDLYGRLNLELGEFGKAETAFSKMKDVDIAKIKVDGLFGLGRAQLILNKLPEAASSFAAIGKVDSNDAEIQTIKIIAQCYAARVLAADNKSAEAISQLEELIKREDADNGILFAAAYNALGYSHMKAGSQKRALMAYLHTNLLYHTQSEMDAEALYHLATIWTTQNETDRATRARQSLKSKYRNSYWSTKL